MDGHQVRGFLSNADWQAVMEDGPTARLVELILAVMAYHEKHQELFKAMVEQGLPADTADMWARLRLHSLRLCKCAIVNAPEYSCVTDPYGDHDDQNRGADPAQ